MKQNPGTEKTKNGFTVYWITESGSREERTFKTYDEAKQMESKRIFKMEWVTIEEAKKRPGVPFIAYKRLISEPMDVDNFWVAEWRDEHGELVLDCDVSNPTHASFCLTSHP